MAVMKCFSGYLGDLYRHAYSTIIRYNMMHMYISQNVYKTQSKSVASACDNAFVISHNIMSYITWFI